MLGSHHAQKQWNDVGMLADGLRDGEYNMRMFPVGLLYETRNIFIDMPAGIKKVEKNDNLAGPLVDTAINPLGNTRLFYFQEGVFQDREPASLP